MNLYYKNYIAAGLCFDAAARGYRAYFKTMDEPVKVLKMKEITRKAATEYKRTRKAHRLVIGDHYDVSGQRAGCHLINEPHEKASLVITAYK